MVLLESKITIIGKIKLTYTSLAINTMNRLFFLKNKKIKIKTLRKKDVRVKLKIKSINYKE